MNISLLKKIILISAVFLNGCTDSNTENKELWINEEILSHLSDIKVELVSIKKEIATLKSSKNIKKNTITSLKLKSEPLLNKNAKYAVVEFSDYECPFCARHANTVFPQLKEKYIDTGKISYQLRDFPLAFHAKAKSAAVAARCAGKQDKFWLMHEKLFQAKGRLNEKYYLEIAASLNVNLKDFKLCLDDKSILSSVDEDIKYGNSIGVTGTPKFFIGKITNNKITDISVVSGARSFAAFSRVIDKFK